MQLNERRSRNKNTFIRILSYEKFLRTTQTMRKFAIANDKVLHYILLEF